MTPAQSYARRDPVLIPWETRIALAIPLPPLALAVLPSAETPRAVLHLLLACVEGGGFRSHGVTLRYTSKKHSDEPEGVLQTANRSGRWSDELHADSAGHHVSGRTAHERFGRELDGDILGIQQPLSPDREMRAKCCAPSWRSPTGPRRG